MKKIKQFLINNTHPIMAFILGIIVSGTTVYAATILISSDQVRYDNTNSGLQSSTVQDALDALSNKATSDEYFSKRYKDLAGTPTNYNDTNKPTTSSPTTPPSGKNVYLGLYADGQYGVCINRGGTQHCFRHNNWLAESKHVQEVFSDISCDVFSSCVYCIASDFNCGVSSNGSVSCNGYGVGSVECY